MSSLSSLAEHLPAEAVSALAVFGATSIGDIAGCTLDEWKAMAPDAQEAAEAWVQLWVDASSEFNGVLRAADAQLRDVVPLGRPPARSSATARRPSATRLPPSRRRRLRETKTKGVDHAKERYVAHLLEIMREAGASCGFSSEWQACSDASDIQAWEAAFAGMLTGKFEIGSIRGAWRAWRRWLHFLDGRCERSRAFAPPPVLLHQWLQDSSSGGPTVASGLYYAFGWLKQHCGLHALPLDSPLLQTLRRPEAGHVASQAAALTLDGFRRILACALPLDTGKSVAAGLLLRWLVSGLRHAHATRALRCPARSNPRQHVWQITRGKVNSRAAFFVATPLYLHADRDYFAELHAKVIEVLGEVVADSIFLPDISLMHGRWSIAAAHLPIDRAQVVIRTLVEPGGTSTEAAPVTTYAFRRFFPTVSESLQMTETERSSLGNWVDRLAQPQGGGRRQEPMHARYSDSRLEESANVKRLLLAVLLAPHPSGRLDTHQELSAFIPRLADLRAQVRGTTWGAFTSRASAATGSTPSLAASSSTVPSAPQRTSSSSSPSPSCASSGSSCSTTPAPLPPPPPVPTHDPEAAEMLRWITPKWRNSAIHIASSESGGWRFCNKAELDWGWEEGKGPRSAEASGRPLCLGCLRTAPRVVAAAFRSERAD